MINRRLFVRSASASLAGRAVTARAQVPPTAVRVGVLSPGPAAADEFADVLTNMKALGWSMGRNIAVEARSAASDMSRLRPLADDLVRRRVDALVTYGTEATAAAKGATNTIPIVMASSGDPVGTGLVASLSRPGGNVTGYSIVYPEVARKRAALLHELLPHVRRVTVLLNPTGRLSFAFRWSADVTYRSLGVEPTFDEIASESQFMRALQEARRQRAEALDINLSIFNAAMTEALLRSRIPALVDDKQLVRAGALMSFSPDQRERNQRLASILDRVLRGRTPADLPIEQPDRFDLVLNARTARDLNVRIPDALLARATEVVE